MANSRDPAELLSSHRAVWQKKETLRRIYSDYYRRLLGSCPPDGTVLDIGGGSAHVKEFRADVLTLDILPFPGIDIVADAHEIPLPDASLAGIIMIDVLHHLERPVPFLREAARLLRPGGTLAMVEPGITPVSWWFYRFLHQEPVILSQDPFEMFAKRPDKDPFDSNQAIPTLLVGSAHARNRLAEAVPELHLEQVDWLSLVAYPLSGGFKNWCLMPAGLTDGVVALESRLPLILRRLAAFRVFASWTRK